MNKITKIKADDIEIGVDSTCKAQSFYIVPSIDPMTGQYSVYLNTYSDRNEAMVMAECMNCRIYQLDLPTIKKEAQK